MKKTKTSYEKALNKYLLLLKKENLFEPKNKFFYENNVEKLKNWNNVKFKNSLKWYNKIRKEDKTKVQTIPLDKMKSWSSSKQKGNIFHKSGGFFKIEGKRITNSKREVKKWDQPFIVQVGYNGGIIGLVRANINKIPHYLVEAKYEPGNFNNIQLSPSLQATYSNLKRVHRGERNKVIKKYFKGNFKTIRKFWVTEDGGRLYKKRNLHWIIQYNGKVNIPGDTYKWLTLWELNKFIKLGSFVGPHLRSILSLI